MGDQVDRDNLKPFYSSVQTQFHLRGNPLKRTAWYLGLAGSALAFCWLAWSAASGHTQIYQAGPVSSVHSGFEHQCSECHVEWSVLNKLLSFSDRLETRSTCLRCHEAVPHAAKDQSVLARGTPGLKEYTSATRDFCGSCHSEHSGQQDLLDVADEFCVSCHQSINSFTSGHPEFAVQRLLRSAAGDDSDALLRLGIGTEHGVLQRLKWLMSEGGAGAWEGRGGVRFNHDLHLRVNGIMGPNGELRELSQNCDACHEEDADSGLMQPINYERHCAECHQLVFDAERIEWAGENRERSEVLRIESSRLINESGGDDLSVEMLQTHPEQFRPLVVPHEEMQIVRGFLTDFYRLQVQRRAMVLDSAAGDNSGIDVPDLLRSPDEEAIRRAVDLSQQRLSSAPYFSLEPPQFRFLTADTRTGCFYCHESATSDGPEGRQLVRVATEIPDRWFQHARFSHHPHSQSSGLKCRVCHQLGADESGGPALLGNRTGDVLMPGIDVCQACHADEPDVMQLSSAVRAVKGRARCVECHDYHKPHGLRNRQSAADPPVFADDGG